MNVFEDLDNHIIEMQYDVSAVGFDPYNAREFIDAGSREWSFWN